MRLNRRFAEIFTRWRKSQSGNIAIVSALAMPAVVGFVGLGADTGYWYFRERMVQGAADVTAYNGAAALRAGSTADAVSGAASADAQTNGWKAGVGTIAVHSPPISGTHQTPNSVEVVLSETVPRFFSQIYTSEPLTVHARAVANYVSSGNACLLSLNRVAHQALKFWGNNLTTMNGCNIMSDSMQPDAIAAGGSSDVTVPCAISAGGVSVTSELTLTSCASPVTNAYPAPDPYKNLAAPPIPGAFTNPPNNGNLSPGKYNGLTIQDTRTLNPGVYVISGGTLKINAGANISGSGVMFYLTNGATVQFNGNAHMSLSAPTSGTYSGMLFYGDRTQANAIQKFNGDSTSTMTGALYFPTQKVQLLGNFSGANGCMQVVSDTIELTGSTSLSGTCPGTGLSTVPIPGTLAMVE